MSISYSNLLLNEFTRLYEKQDVLNKSIPKELLNDYGYSEIHCIDLIGKLEQPNVTKLSLNLSMAKSSISKIVKKLLKNGDIESYQCIENKKEIYYRLTEKGEKLFNEHSQQHLAWEERDKKFFEELSQNDLQITLKFLNKYNNYLESKIEELK